MHWLRTSFLDEMRISMMMMMMLGDGVTDGCACNADNGVSRWLAIRIKFDGTRPLWPEIELLTHYEHNYVQV